MKRLVSKNHPFVAYQLGNYFQYQHISKHLAVQYI